MSVRVLNNRGNVTGRDCLRVTVGRLNISPAHLVSITQPSFCRPLATLLGLRQLRITHGVPRGVKLQLLSILLHNPTA